MKSDKYLDLWDLYHQRMLPESKIIPDFMACFYVYSSEDRLVAEPIAEVTETKPDTLKVADTKLAEIKQPVAEKNLTNKKLKLKNTL